MRTYILQRDEDETGVSGTGVVAEVVEFTDGVCVVRWCVPDAPASTAVHADRESLLAIHGHGGRTRLLSVGAE